MAAPRGMLLVANHRKPRVEMELYRNPGTTPFDLVQMQVRGERDWDCSKTRARSCITPAGRGILFMPRKRNGSDG